MWFFSALSWIPTPLPKKKISTVNSFQQVKTVWKLKTTIIYTAFIQNNTRHKHVWVLVFINISESYVPIKSTSKSMVDNKSIWNVIERLILPTQTNNLDRRFNPYDRNLTRPITNKPVVGALLSPAIGMLQNQLITGIIWWKIVFGMLFVLVAGVSNWVFFWFNFFLIIWNHYTNYFVNF